jgi:hypothetical protein
MRIIKYVHIKKTLSKRKKISSDFYNSDFTTAVTYVFDLAVSKIFRHYCQYFRQIYWDINSYLSVITSKFF